MVAAEYDIKAQKQAISQSATYLKQQLKEHSTKISEFAHPRTMIICGSGLGGISKRISQTPTPLVIDYKDIPGFKQSTVPGHSGKLIFGEMNGSPVVLMSGRLHGYEGYAIFDTIFPIRVMYELGSVKNLIVTNAAGGVREGFKVGDVMCIYDHLNIVGMAGNHPLKGPNYDDVGPRFLPLSDAYDLGLRQLLFKKRDELKITRPLHEGTYTFVSGPTFETRAECSMIRKMGGDTVGMSTVPEVIVARHCGWKVLAISLITNECVVAHPPSALDKNPIDQTKGSANHQEVLAAGAEASVDVENMVNAVVGEL